jgi:hypothetical protein
MLTLPELLLTKPLRQWRLGIIRLRRLLAEVAQKPANREGAIIK